MKSTTHGSLLPIRAFKARAAFLDMRGPAAFVQRFYEIQQLPTAQHRGRSLRTLRCQGTTGRGPHDLNVPEYILWAVIDFRAFRCPFH